MSRWPPLPPGNRFDAIIALARELRAEQQARGLTHRIMRAERSAAAVRARYALEQVTPVKRRPPA